jgi:hypothetical protein
MGKQIAIPGTTQKAVPAIDRAAEEYVDIRDKRGDAEAQARGLPSTSVACAATSLTVSFIRCTSTDEPLDVTMVTKTKARVRGPKDADADESDEA